MKEQNRTHSYLLRNSIIVVVAFLVGIGIVMIYSSSISSANSDQAARNLIQQLIYVAVATGAFIAMMNIDYKHLKKFAVPLLVISIILLGLVLTPLGTEVNGARRWFRFFGISFQPSDFAKISLIIFLAYFLTRPNLDIKSFKKCFVPVMLIILIVAGLVLKEPDFGTAVILVLVSILVIAIAGVRLVYVGGFALISAPLVYLLVASSSYRLQRFVSFVDPWKYARSSGYQLIQSFMALGSGGIFGVGIGAGRQKLNFLPEATSDFIFSVIGEELGLLGTVLVVSLFALFFILGIQVAKRVEDAFGSLLALGITCFITMQAAINIAVVTGLMPTKGISLPFVSSGGSSLLFMMIGAGILVNIASHITVKEKTEEEPVIELQPAG